MAVSDTLGSTDHASPSMRDEANGASAVRPARDGIGPQKDGVATYSTVLGVIEGGFAGLVIRKGAIQGPSVITVMPIIVLASEAILLRDEGGILMEPAGDMA